MIRTHAFRGHEKLDNSFYFKTYWCSLTATAVASKGNNILKMAVELDVVGNLVLGSFSNDDDDGGDDSG